MKCPKCGTEMNQGAYTVDPPIPYVGCPKCGYHNEGNSIFHARGGEGSVSVSSIWVNDGLAHGSSTVIDPTAAKVDALVEKVDELEKKVAKLDADLYRKEIALKWVMADLKPSAGRRIPYFMPKDAFDRLSDDVKRKMTPCPGKIDLTDEEYEEAVKAAISKAKGETATPEHPHYVYIIRERTREFTASSDWDIVGNVCYPTFKDANEKMKKLIKDYRQLDPDYNANNLNIIQVRLEE